jgi:hypothetical protein
MSIGNDHRLQHPQLTAIITITMTYNEIVSVYVTISVSR